MPKARNASSKGSKKTSRRNKKSLASEPEPSLAMKAEELSDAEAKQLLTVHALEPTLATNDGLEDISLVHMKRDYLEEVELLQFRPDVLASEYHNDLTFFDYNAPTPGLTTDASSPASSELLTPTPTNDFLLGNIELWSFAQEEAIANSFFDPLQFPSLDEQWSGPQFPYTYEAVNTLSDGFSPELHDNFQPYPCIKEEALTEPYADLFRTPSLDDQWTGHYLDPHYPNNVDTLLTSTNEFISSLDENSHSWSIIEEETFIQTYAELLEIPRPKIEETIEETDGKLHSLQPHTLEDPPVKEEQEQKEEETNDKLLLLQANLLEVPPVKVNCPKADDNRAYTQPFVPILPKGDIAPNPQNPPTETPKVKKGRGRPKKLKIPTISRSVTNAKYKLKETERRTKSYKNWLWKPTPNAKTRFFFGWNSPYLRFKRLSRKNADRPVVVDEDSLSAGEFVCGAECQDGSAQICALCYAAVELIDLVEDDEAENHDTPPTLEPPIEICLAIPQTVSMHPSHILSTPFPFNDTSVKLYTSKASELSAIPFLNAMTL